MPISTTTNSVSALASNSVRGTPSSLFWFALVATVLKVVERTSRTRFFVVVLPIDPVSAMTLPCKWPRQPRASSVKARAVSSTRRMAAPSAFAVSSAASGSSCITNTATAPERRAPSTKSWPSTRSPGKATYTKPGFTSRESHVTPHASFSRS